MDNLSDILWPMGLLGGVSCGLNNLFKVCTCILIDALIFVCVSICTSSLIFVQYNTADHFSVFISFIIKKKAGCYVSHPLLQGTPF